MDRDLKEGEIIRRKLKKPFYKEREYIYGKVVSDPGMSTDPNGNALFVDQAWNYKDCQDKNNTIRALWSRKDDIEVFDNHEQA